MSKGEGAWRFMNKRERAVVKILASLLLPWTITEWIRERGSRHE